MQKGTIDSQGDIEFWSDKSPPQDGADVKKITDES